MEGGEERRRRAADAGPSHAGLSGCAGGDGERCQGGSCGGEWRSDVGGRSERRRGVGGHGGEVRSRGLGDGGGGGRRHHGRPAQGGRAPPRASGSRAAARSSRAVAPGGRTGRLALLLAAWLASAAVVATPGSSRATGEVIGEGGWVALQETRGGRGRVGEAAQAAVAAVAAGGAARGGGRKSGVLREGAPPPPPAPPSSPGGGQSALGSLLRALLHLDESLASLVARSPRVCYAALFATVFLETGVVVLPFLPGDSLLFAAGALAARGALSAPLAAVGVASAAFAGDSLNYAAGASLGRRALRRGLVRVEHVQRTERFFDRHGARAVALARFVPIVRTVAPFLAGVGSMPIGRFSAWNAAGALSWTAACLGGGFLLGNVPLVRDNFGLVALFVALISVAPFLCELVSSTRAGVASRRSQPRITGPSLLLPGSGRPHGSW